MSNLVREDLNPEQQKTWQFYNSGMWPYEKIYLWPVYLQDAMLHKKWDEHSLGMLWLKYMDWGFSPDSAYRETLRQVKKSQHYSKHLLLKEHLDTIVAEWYMSEGVQTKANKVYDSLKLPGEGADYNRLMKLADEKLESYPHEKKDWDRTKTNWAYGQQLFSKLNERSSLENPYRFGGDPDKYIRWEDAMIERNRSRVRPYMAEYELMKERKDEWNELRLTANDNLTLLDRVRRGNIEMDDMEYDDPGPYVYSDVDYMRDIAPVNEHKYEMEKKRRIAESRMAAIERQKKRH
ncbi:MAG: hypothetical protein [Cressdnaviricota sp.]|nr:MAG: hypothetical protein [Cressdnaviricota sp.]